MTVKNPLFLKDEEEEAMDMVGMFSYLILVKWNKM